MIDYNNVLSLGFEQPRLYRNSPIYQSFVSLIHAKRRVFVRPLYIWLLLLHRRYIFRFICCDIRWCLLTLAMGLTIT